MRRTRKMTPFERQVKARLLELDMTQVDLCNRLGIKKQYLNQIFAGDRQNSAYIDRIREVLGISA